jgi:carboxypeptidase Taq
MWCGSNARRRRRWPRAGILYDALIDDYEPGEGRELAALFDRMRPRLVELRARGPRCGRAKASRGAFPA